MNTSLKFHSMCYLMKEPVIYIYILKFREHLRNWVFMGNLIKDCQYIIVGLDTKLLNVLSLGLAFPLKEIICTSLDHKKKKKGIYILNFTPAVAAAKSLQSCPTPCDPIDGCPLGFPGPWDSPGKNTGVGCHVLLQCMKVKSESEVAQS